MTAFTFLRRAFKYSPFLPKAFYRLIENNRFLITGLRIEGAEIPIDRLTAEQVEKYTEGATPDTVTVPWNELTDSQMAYQKATNPTSYTDYIAGPYYDRIRAAQESQNQIAQEQIGLAERQAGIADERLAYYRQYFEPLQDDMIDRAMVGIDQGYAADLAQNKTEQGFKDAKAAARRDMQRIGINPDDERFKSIRDDAKLNEMTAIVNARNQAKLGAIDETQNLRMNVAGMGRGVPVQAQQSLAGAASTMGGANQRLATGSQGLLSAQNMAINSGLQGLSGQLQSQQFQSDLASQNRLDQLYGQQALAATVGDLGATYMGYKMNQQPSIYGSQNPTSFSPGNNAFNPSFNIQSGTGLAGY